MARGIRRNSAGAEALRYLEHVAEIKGKKNRAQAQEERLGHKDVSTTMFYTHVMEKGVSRTASPLDYLDEVTTQELVAVAATRRIGNAREQEGAVLGVQVSTKSAKCLA